MDELDVGDVEPLEAPVPPPGTLTESFEGTARSSARKISSVVLEDNILQKDKVCTAGSNALSGFSAPFDSAVAESCRRAGFSIGQHPCSCELGFSFGEKLGKTAAELALGKRCDAVLCADLLGSSGCDAASRGLLYLRPTYGTVSRYGLVPAAPSMDTIGVLAKTPDDVFSVLSVIAGYDERDGVMSRIKNYTYQPAASELRIGQEGDFELPRKNILFDLMLILSCVELSVNTNRGDELAFLNAKLRTQEFSFDTKLMLIMGAMVFSQEIYRERYRKAMRLRRLVYNEVNELFSQFDALSLPAQSQGYTVSLLCGLPCLFLPVENGYRLMLAKGGNENVLYAVAEANKKPPVKSGLKVVSDIFVKKTNL
ncbi:MAG: amidase [Oscillospiraceae bacterium]|nr:amidase [Oscillospiraceae bacterium]